MVIVRDKRLLGTGACLKKLMSQCKAGMGFIPGMSITVRDICCSCERESWQGVIDQSAGTCNNEYNECSDVIVCNTCLKVLRDTWAYAQSIDLTAVF